MEKRWQKGKPNDHTREILKNPFCESVFINKEKYTQLIQLNMIIPVVEYISSTQDVSLPNCTYLVVHRFQRPLLNTETAPKNAKNYEAEHRKSRVYEKFPFNMYENIPRRI